jgi:hypothetical protein
MDLGMLPRESDNALAKDRVVNPNQEAWDLSIVSLGK